MLDDGPLQPPLQRQCSGPAQRAAAPLEAGQGAASRGTSSIIKNIYISLYSLTMRTHFHRMLVLALLAHAATHLGAVDAAASESLAGGGLATADFSALQSLLPYVLVRSEGRCPAPPDGLPCLTHPMPTALLPPPPRSRPRPGTFLSRSDCGSTTSSASIAPRPSSNLPTR